MIVKTSLLLLLLCNGPRLEGLKSSPEFYSDFFEIYSGPIFFSTGTEVSMPKFSLKLSPFSFKKKFCIFKLTTDLAAAAAAAADSTPHSDVEIKSSPSFSKSCPKSSQTSYTWNALSNAFQNCPKSPQAIGLLLK